MENYIRDNSLKEPVVLKELRESCQHEVNPVQDQLIRTLIKVSGGKKCLVVGKQTGYSALSAALGLPEAGHVFAVDFHQEYVDETYKESFEKAKVQEKMTLKIGNPVEVMDELARENHDETFDFIHIVNGEPLQFENYIERAYVLAKSNGVIVLGDMLQKGRVVECSDDNKKGDGEMSTEQRSAALSVDKLNKKLHKDRRFDVNLLPNGLALLRRTEPQ